MRFKKCKHKGCKEDALYESEFCWGHLPNKHRYKKFIQEKKPTLHITKIGRAIISSHLSEINHMFPYITEANLEKADLSGVNLKRANLVRSNLRDACLNGTNLNRAVLLEANLERAGLSGANLQEAELSKARLQTANLTRANLERTNLLKANLNGAILEETKLTRGSLKGATLTGANLKRANLEQANLVKASLREADLTKANLTKADLRNADLQKANLTDADFRGAILDFTDISGADISGADFRGASLKEIKFSHFICNKPPKLDPRQKDTFKQKRLPPPKVTDQPILRIYLEYDYLPVSDFNTVIRFFDSLYNDILRYQGLKISKERQLRISWIETRTSLEIILEFLNELIPPGIRNPILFIVITFGLANWIWKSVQDRIKQGFEIKKLKKEIAPKAKNELVKYFPDIKQIEIRKDTNQIILWLEKCDEFKTKIDKLPHITKLQVNEIVVKDTKKKEKKGKNKEVGGKNVKK